MKQLTAILSITGSDSMGGAGIQADIKTITALGGYAVTAVSSITIQNSNGIQAIHDLPSEVVVGQVQSIIEEAHPKAIKVGMVRDTNTIKELSHEIIACKHIVLDPGIFTPHSILTAPTEAVNAWKRYLIPTASLLLLRCSEAEVLLDTTINTDEDMIIAANRLHDMGAQYVLLRGGQHIEGMLVALLSGEGNQQFFSSRNTEGWQKHGVGGALSSAIATRLALGDDMPRAIENAHIYMHSQVVYAVTSISHNLRSADIYNDFVSLIAANYRQAHDVTFYADRLAITTRYLNQITAKMVSRSPKQIIADYLMSEAKKLLETTRLTIQEIATDLGFSSQAMFCKFFSTQEGCSPSVYRNFPKVTDTLQ